MYNPYENREPSPRDPEQNREQIPEQAAPTPSEPEAAPGTVTYHTGPIHAGSAYFPQQGVPAQSAPVQPPRTGYTWGPQQTHSPYGQQTRASYPVQPAGGYYAPIQPPVREKKKKSGGKFLLKLLAAVLCCALVSAGTMGAFVLMVQNGTIQIQSPADAQQTAAFTIYKQAESTKKPSLTVSTESMTPQEVAQKVIPSVVCIQNYRITQQNGFFFGFGYSGGESGSLSPAGEGSGIIISKDGYIVTNQHVVDGATSLKVVTSEGLTYEAELVGEDTQTDLAVIRIEADVELTPADFGASEDLQVADEVMAVGNPGGLQLNSSVTFGRISALNRQITNSETGYTMSCIQTDAAINPGNSGGALVDMNGFVVGINSSKIVDTSYEGLGFAIPSDTVQPIVSDLIEYGYVKDRPMLGISGQYIDRLTASFYGMSPGYYVAQVNSLRAKESGLQRGDMIVAVDDVQVTSSSTITNYLMNKKPGDTVILTVNRSMTGEEGLTLEVVLSENTGISE